MLKNEELKQIKEAYLLIVAIKRGLITPDETETLHKTGETLKAIYDKYTEKKKIQSDRSNVYNKTHPEAHKRHNNNYIKNNREKMKAYQKEYYLKHKKKKEVK